LCKKEEEEKLSMIRDDFHFHRRCLHVPYVYMLIRKYFYVDVSVYTSLAFCICTKPVGGIHIYSKSRFVSRVYNSNFACFVRSAVGDSVPGGYALTNKAFCSPLSLHTHTAEVLFVRKKYSSGITQTFYF
jgi:hypothetical protein